MRIVLLEEMKMKTCPNCGKEVSPNDTFCKNCGHDLKKQKDQVSQLRQPVQPQKVQTSPTTPTRTRTQRNHPKNNKKRNIILAICSILIVLAVFFFVINIFKSSNKNNSTNLTPTQQVATIVSYGNLNYSSNEGWGDAYDEAKNNQLKVKRYSSYDFGEYTATAPKGGALYVLNQHVGYVITKPDNFNNSDVIFIDDTGKEKSLSTAEVIKKVKNSYKSSVIETLAKGITIDETIHAKPEEKQSEPTEDSSSENNSSSSKSSSSANSSDIVWTRSQNDRLAELMDEFGDKMDQDYDQSYTKYDTSSSIHTIAGEEYPEIFKQKTFKLFSGDNEGTKINIGWDPDLTGKYSWQVFAIYNADISNPEQHATYLFCYHDGKPYALVDQTTNGNDIMVKQTANKYLLNGFYEIAQ